MVILLLDGLVKRSINRPGHVYVKYAQVSKLTRLRIQPKSDCQFCEFIFEQALKEKYYAGL